MKTRKTVSESWNEYEQVVGGNQLLNFGIIFLDKYNKPIDNEYELEELYEKYQEVKKLNFTECAICMTNSQKIQKFAMGIY